METRVQAFITQAPRIVMAVFNELNPAGVSVPGSI